MGNKVLNASGLDGVTDWTGATSVDETTVGAEGRAVIVSSSSSLRSNATAVTVGATIEAAGLYAATGGGAALEVEYLNGGGSVIATAAVPAKAAGDGSPRRGLALSFNIARGRLVVPASAVTARLRARGTGTVYLLRPWLETLLYSTERALWQAGPHTNADLNLLSWPTKLPAIEEEAFSIEAIATRGAFAGDTGIPITRQKMTTRRFMLRAGLRLDTEEVDRLETFFAQSSALALPFWFTRQDTMQLCRARWLADGEPSDSGLVRGRRRRSFGLLLEVS